MQRNEILMVYGDDAESMTRALLERINLASFVPRTARIALKPNLVVAATAETGATTHPEIVRTIISYLREHDYGDVRIVESAWIGDSTQRGFKVNGYDRISTESGVPLVDVKQDEYLKKTAHGITMEISKTILETDFLINLPVLKGHCQTAMTCALKNMKGCLSDSSKRLFHKLGLHDPIAALNSIRSADLVIVDSLNGDLDFEEGGNPVQTNRMFAGLDSVLVDTYGASLMGFELADIPYITLAEEFGVGSTELATARIIELNSDASNTQLRPTGRVRELQRHTLPSSACSACYGNLIHALARLDERGLLIDLDQKLHIGQDYKGKSGCGLGIGSCTCGYTSHVAGCPPKAIEIVRFLERKISARHESDSIPGV